MKIFLYLVLVGAYALFFGGMFTIMIATIVVGSVKDSVFTDISKVPESEYAILLGTPKISQDGLSLYIPYNYRIDAAAALYLNGKVKKIIVSGEGDNDMSKKFVGNHVFSMKTDLMHLGVDPTDIIEDHAGYRTLDSVLRAKDTYKVKNPIFVSQYSHCVRAVFQAKINNYNAYGFSRDRIMSPYDSYKFSWRESQAWVLAMLDVFIFKTKADKYDEPIVTSTSIVSETDTASN